MPKKIELRRKNLSGFTDDDLLYVRASWNHLDDKPGTFVPSSHGHDPDDIEPGSNGQVLKTVNGVTAWATDETGSNNYVDGVSGNGDGTLTLTRSGLSNLSVNLAHNHSEYSLSEGLVNTYKASGGTGNDPDTVMILCPYTASQNVLGTVFIERTSGHRGATQIDILYSSGTTQGNTSQSLRVHQTDYYPGEFSLVVRDVDGTDYVCLRRESIDGNYFQTKSWFTGFTTYTGGRFADWLVTPSGGSTLPLTGRTQLHGSTKIDDNEIYHEGHKPTLSELGAASDDHTHSEYATTASLADVATSGSYDDLSDKPSIVNTYPTALDFNTGNGVLTLTLNNTDTVTEDLDGRYAYSSHSHSYLPLTGGTIDGGQNTTLTIKSDDDGRSQIELIGDSQGTGRVYVGQSGSHGGGIEYNGDGSPTTTGAGSDYITLFRRSSSTDYWTAKNLHNSNDWAFRGKLFANGSNEVYHEGHKPTLSELGAAADDHTHSDYLTSVNLGKTVESSYISISNSGGSSVTIGAATNSDAGLMTNLDHSKLEGIDANANNYTLPWASETVKGGAKIWYDSGTDTLNIETS